MSHGGYQTFSAPEIECCPGWCGNGYSAKCADFVVAQLVAMDDDPIDRVTVAPVQLCRKTRVNPSCPGKGSGRQAGGGRRASRPQPGGNSPGGCGQLVPLGHVDVAVDRPILAAQRASSDVPVGQRFRTDERPGLLPHALTLASESDKFVERPVMPRNAAKLVRYLATQPHTRR